MKKIKILLIALVLIVAGTFFSYVNAEEESTSKTLDLKFSKRKTI